MTEVKTLTEQELLGRGGDWVRFVGYKGKTYERLGLGYVRVYPFDIERIGRHTADDFEKSRRMSLRFIMENLPKVYKAFGL